MFVYPLVKTYPNLVCFCSLCTVQIGTTAAAAVDGVIITVSAVRYAATPHTALIPLQPGAAPLNAQPHMYVQAPIVKFQKVMMTNDTIQMEHKWVLWKPTVYAKSDVCGRQIRNCGATSKKKRK
ncbi:hypothetical protein WUBG_17409 [Wuchereria bancrofti]|uniref:Uncharacterized protein n=1 Tax=Wuchereria bancrofti TaxID=6293 RepID=J9E418_WUCBA|nr:hypothetical protein WUBG_17409 [Wuchereria bancrofti]